VFFEKRRGALPGSGAAARSAEYTKPERRASSIRSWHEGRRKKEDSVGADLRGREEQGEGRHRRGGGEKYPGEKPKTQVAQKKKEKRGENK